MSERKLHVVEQINNASDTITSVELSELKKDIGCLSDEKISTLRAIIEQKTEITAETKQKLKDLLIECNPLPKIAARNPQIYEFLDGKITDKDTGISLKKKLEKKIHSLVLSPEGFSDLSYYVGMEKIYRQENSKPESSLIESLIKQIIATRNLSNQVKNTPPDNIENINDFLIEFYNQNEDGRIFTSADFEKWKKEIEQDRKNAGYSYEKFQTWIPTYMKTQQAKK